MNHNFIFLKTVFAINNRCTTFGLFNIMYLFSLRSQNLLQSWVVKVFGGRVSTKGFTAGIPPTYTSSLGHAVLPNAALAWAGHAVLYHGDDHQDRGGRLALPPPPHRPHNRLQCHVPRRPQHDNTGAQPTAQ